MAEKKVILPENTDELIEKWSPVIEGTGKWEKVVDGMPKVDVKDHSLLATQLEILEQTELQEGSVASNVSTYTPVLIPMVRRIMPSIIGGKIFGTQPMTGPSGMIFSLKSLYQGDAGDAMGSVFEILMLNTAVAVFETPGQVISGDVAGNGIVVHGEGKLVLVKLTSPVTTFADDTNVDDAAGFTISVAGVDNVLTDAEALASVIFKNFSGSMETATGETLGSGIKELGFVLNSSTVTAKTRKLKTRWTIELEDDLRAVHGANAEQLLSGFCGDEIVREMNREFMDTAHTYGEATTDNGFAASTWTYSATAGDQGYNESERYKALGNAIATQSRKLAKSNMRGPATFMLVYIGALTSIEKSGRFKGIPNPNMLLNPLVGKFDGMDVFVDMFPTTSGEFVILGYKGDEIDAGFYYCPYIPLKVNKGYGEEDNIPRLFFSTRYGMKENPFGGKNYFHKMTLNLSAVSGLS